MKLYTQIFLGFLTPILFLFVLLIIEIVNAATFNKIYLVFLISGITLSIAAMCCNLIFVAGPIDEIVQKLPKVVQGSLNETFQSRSCKEIKIISESINDLSTNYQELLLMVWNYSQNCLSILDGILLKKESKAKSLLSGEIYYDLEKVRSDIAEIQRMADSFDLFDVIIEKDKALAGKISESAFFI